MAEIKLHPDWLARIGGEVEQREPLLGGVVGFLEEVRGHLQPFVRMQSTL